jgi:nitrate reductase cytochrome c-type subunit
MSRHVNRTAVPVILVVALAVGCADRRPLSVPPPDGGPAGVPEEEVGLSPGRLEALPPLAPMPTPPGDPGDAPSRLAAYDGAPPVVPHAIADFVPIERAANVCLDCHMEGEKIAGEPTPIPASHFVDLRNAPASRGDEVAGARWVCIACHVSVTDTPPLVASEF